MKNSPQVIGAALGQCGRITGCENAPSEIQAAYPHWRWQDIIYLNSDASKLEIIPELKLFSEKLAAAVANCVKAGDSFCVIGGDNASSIGTWSGAASAIDGDLGLIWLDAHCDSHTPETSPTKNVHGMPVATLLGRGDKRLTDCVEKKLRPENVILIGMRSYEQEEIDFLDEVDVKVYFIEEVLEKGFSTILQEAQQQLSKTTSAHGIMLDIDFIEPLDCSAVGTPEPDGVPVEDVIAAFSMMQKNQLIGIEITEYNPKLRIERQTEETIGKVYEACF